MLDLQYTQYVSSVSLCRCAYLSLFLSPRPLAYIISLFSCLSPSLPLALHSLTTTTTMMTTAATAGAGATTTTMFFFLPPGVVFFATPSTHEPEDPTMSSNSSRISSHVFRSTKVARLGHAVPSSATRCQDPPLPMLHAAMKPAASALF